MTRSVYFEVLGEPKPKGSVSGFPVKRKGGKTGVVIVHSKGSKSWELLVREQVAKTGALFEGPVRVILYFYLPRPKTVKRKYPEAKPDLDKLVRATLDALTGTLLRDDAQVVSLEATKEYADGQRPVGATVEVAERE